jgi:hypothetical protein
MKKLLTIILSISLITMIYGQKKNGTVYSEHESIDLTNELWKAFAAGDQAAYAACFADDAMSFRNSDFDNPTNKEKMVGGLKWWASSFKNLSVKNDGEGYPDAIKYGNDELWVQDWLRVKGTHIESGINMDLSLHNVYRFNEEGKIEMMISYFNNDVFDAINSSSNVMENGDIYIYHPYITNARKLVNAYSAGNLEELESYYDSKASFGNSTMPWKKTMNWQERKASIEEARELFVDIQMKQVGYPDCMHYAKGDSYVVYSWWTWTAKQKSDGKIINLPLMLSHSFNDEGKVVREYAHYSSNHFD